jgi:hypothetical protein
MNRHKIYIRRERKSVCEKEREREAVHNQIVLVLDCNKAGSK